VSNYLAIATVTATLQRILQSSVQADVDGVRVTTVQPGQIGKGTPETGLNLFLYQVSRNLALILDRHCGGGGCLILESGMSLRRVPCELTSKSYTFSRVVLT
jgi:hypothetical protein